MDTVSVVCVFICHSNLPIHILWQDPVLPSCSLGFRLSSKGPKCRSLSVTNLQAHATRIFRDSLFAGEDGRASIIYLPTFFAHALLSARVRVKWQIFPRCSSSKRMPSRNIQSFMNTSRRICKTIFLLIASGRIFDLTNLLLEISYSVSHQAQTTWWNNPRAFLGKRIFFSLDSFGISDDEI